jgi:hypothetical protein
MAGCSVPGSAYVGSPIEIAKGRPEAAGSAFAWVRTKLNLPSMDDYDPSRPSVMKMKLRPDNRLAADIIAFMMTDECSD